MCPPKFVAHRSHALFSLLSSLLSLFSIQTTTAKEGKRGQKRVYYSLSIFTVSICFFSLSLFLSPHPKLGWRSKNPQCVHSSFGALARYMTACNWGLGGVGPPSLISESQPFLCPTTKPAESENRRLRPPKATFNHLTLAPRLIYLLFFSPAVTLVQTHTISTPTFFPPLYKPS